MFPVLLISLFAIVKAQRHDEPVCVRLGSVYESMCPSQIASSPLTSRQGLPGKRGAIGERGERGYKGSKGAKGNAREPNYVIVEEMISERIQKVLDAQMRTFENVSAFMTQANEKIRQLENRTDYCPMKYNGKCFWIEYRGGNDVTLEQGREICAAQGGIAANIYSNDHFYMMLGYLGTFARRHAYADVWTGMTYNSQSRTVTLSDGTEAPFLKWHPGHPTGCCIIVLRSRAAWTNNSQYFYVSLSVSRRMGVICEK